MGNKFPETNVHYHVDFDSTCICRKKEKVYDMTWYVNGHGLWRAADTQVTSRGH